MLDENLYQAGTSCAGTDANKAVCVCVHVRPRARARGCGCVCVHMANHPDFSRAPVTNLAQRSQVTGVDAVADHHCVPAVCMANPK